jgi:hypothetical protein
MTLERMTTMIYLKEVLELVKEVRNVCYEIKGFLGFQEPIVTAPAQAYGHYDNVTGREVEEMPMPTEDYEHVTHEPDKAPYYDRVRNDPKIADLKVGDSPVHLTAWVESKEKVGTFIYPASHKSRAGQQGRVQNIILSDGSGTIKLCLWNEQIDKFTFSTGAEIVIDAWKIGEHEGQRNIVMGPKGSIRARGQEALE